MSEKDELRTRLKQLQRKVDANQASFDEELAFAHSVISQLIEDHAWIEGVAEQRSERISALEAELRAAYFQIEALQVSGKKDKKYLGRIVMSFMTGVASVASLSGWNLRDLVERPSDPVAPIVSILSPGQRIELDLIEGRRDIASAGVVDGQEAHDSLDLIEGRRDIASPGVVDSQEAHDSSEIRGARRYRPFTVPLAGRSRRTEQGIEIINASDRLIQVLVSTAHQPNAFMSPAMGAVADPAFASQIAVDGGKGQVTVRNYGRRIVFVSVREVG